MEEWYYAIDGVQQGPVSRDALMQLLASGQVAGDSLVWREGMGDWLPANRVPELANTARPTPTVSPQFQGSPQLLNYGLGDSVYPAQVGPLPYAGFWIRFAALIIDSVVITAAWWAVAGCIFVLMAAAGANNAVNAAILDGLGFLGFIVVWLYFALMTSSPKQASLGMMAVGIRVTDLYGRRISFGRATGRFFAKWLSACFCYAGYIMVAFTEKKQGLHDMVAGTLVLRN
jgi:uncharacterized RDD family membrane protein YckC